MKNIRYELEQREEQYLSPFAIKSSNSSREFDDDDENENTLRTAFQRDRDRIIHSKAFRRLKHKSQVLVAPPHDHVTTRLTHVLEVSQVGRTIARALKLNEDLVESAGLGHDLGHTPFGHIGEDVLNKLLENGFRHSRNSVRVVKVLEKQGKGLNLTVDVIEAIKLHSKPRGEFLSEKNVKVMSLEAQIVRISDAVAYLAHDILDCLRTNYLSVNDFPAELINFLNISHAARLNQIVSDIIYNSFDCRGDDHAPNSQPCIRMSEDMAKLITKLRNFMFGNFYLPASSSEKGKRASYITELIYYNLLKDPSPIPQWIIELNGDNIQQSATDYLVGMTDNFAIAFAEKIEPSIGDVFSHL